MVSAQAIFSYVQEVKVIPTSISSHDRIIKTVAENEWSTDSDEVDEPSKVPSGVVKSPE